MLAPPTKFAPPTAWESNFFLLLLLANEDHQDDHWVDHQEDQDEDVSYCGHSCTGGGGHWNLPRAFHHWPEGNHQSVAQLATI